MPWNEKNDWLKNDSVPLDSYKLLRVYETAQTVDVGELKRAAKELYPERFTDQEPRINVNRGSGRGFDHNGECVRAKYTIYGSKLYAIGVMDDGTAYIY